MKNYPFIVLLILIATNTPVVAEDQYPHWSISGFGTFGLAGSDSRQIGFTRDRSETRDATRSLSLTTDSRLGVQIDADLSSSLHTTVQWVARDHAGDFIEQNLDWAFLRWKPAEGVNFRVGRLGADVFLLSDYRNVGYTYPWMRPPHEFYSNLPIYHFDGMDITKKWSINNSFLSLKFFAGYALTQLAYSDQIYSVESPVTGGNISYESGDWRTRASYAYLHLLTELPAQSLLDAINNPLVNIAMPGINQFTKNLQVKNTDIHFFSLGTAYDDGIWLAQAEASYMHTETTFFPSQTSAYLSIGRRFSSLTVYSLFGIAETLQKKLTVPDPLYPAPQFQQLQHILDQNINNGIKEKSISLGFRWDFYTNMAFKAQWTQYWLDNNGAAAWLEPESGAIPRAVSVWSCGIDFIF